MLTHTNGCYPKFYLLLVIFQTLLNWSTLRNKLNLSFLSEIALHHYFNKFIFLALFYVRTTYECNDDNTTRCSYLGYPQCQRPGQSIKRPRFMTLESLKLRVRRYFIHLLDRHFYGFKNANFTNESEQLI